MLISNKLYIGIITFFVIVISIILHEIAHGYVAKYLGDDTAEEEGRLTLNPIPHIDPIMTLALPLILAVTGQPIFGAAKPVPVLRHRLKWNEFGMALVAIAGPLTNIVLAGIGGLILRIGGINDVYWTTWWIYFVYINVGFALFNLIPTPPLDGSRVLYAFAPTVVQEFMDRIEQFGFLLIAVLVILGMPLLGPVLNNVYQVVAQAILGI
ncbi:MAG: site-2 protease family protein [Candidatus Saccharimonadales bacterium]